MAHLETTHKIEKRTFIVGLKYRCRRRRRRRYWIQAAVSNCAMTVGTTQILLRQCEYKSKNRFFIGFLFQLLVCNVNSILSKSTARNRRQIVVASPDLSPSADYVFRLIHKYKNNKIIIFDFILFSGQWCAQKWIRKGNRTSNDALATAEASTWRH